MECQECQKRPATLRFTQVINGNKTEKHVCEVCAKEKGYITYPEEGYSLHNLLKGLFNVESTHLSKHQGQSFQPSKDLHCQKCGLTFTEFQRRGKFGCATCYDVFSARLDPIFRRVHSGNIKHHGKIPKRKGGSLHLKKQIEQYQDKLRKLVEDEAFEDAAKVRDKIKALKKEQQNKNRGDDA